MTKEYIREHSKIYGWNLGCLLTKYKEAINEVCMNFCMHNPNLLSDQKTLQVGESGYNYKKGKSRSKRLNPGGDGSSVDKRLKMNKDFHLTRIQELREQIKDKNEQVK